MTKKHKEDTPETEKTVTPENSSGGIVIDESQDQALNSGSSRIKIAPAKLAILAALGISLPALGILGGFNYIKSHLHFGSDDAPKSKTTRTYSSAPDSIGKFIPPELPKAAPVPEPAAAAAPEPEHEPVIRPGEPAPITEQAANPQDELLSKRLASGINSHSATAVSAAANTNTVSQSENANAQADRRVKLMANIDYTLVKGTKIPCVLETNIISEQDGYTSCVISQDVYSGNARVLLLEKGTRVTGEYSGSVKNGDRRLQIIWDRLITPYDIAVQIQSPSTGRLGASGVTGKVDNRWGLRIGSALLVSLISDTLKIAGDKSDSAEVIVDSSTADTSQSLAEKILEKNIDLSPIIYLREGEVINIYVADDVDLSAVYQARNAWFGAQ